MIPGARPGKEGGQITRGFGRAPAGDTRNWGALQHRRIAVTPSDLVQYCQSIGCFQSGSTPDRRRLGGGPASGDAGPPPSRRRPAVFCPMAFLVSWLIVRAWRPRRIQRYADIAPDPPHAGVLSTNESEPLWHLTNVVDINPPDPNGEQYLRIAFAKSICIFISNIGLRSLDIFLMCTGCSKYAHHILLPCVSIWWIYLHCWWCIFNVSYVVIFIFKTEK